MKTCKLFSIKTFLLISLFFFLTISILAKEVDLWVLSVNDIHGKNGRGELKAISEFVDKFNTSSVQNMLLSEGPYNYQLTGSNNIDNFWTEMLYQDSIENSKQRNNLLLLNAGDTIDSKDVNDVPTFKWIYKMKFDASTIGNHDISRGIYHFRDFSHKYKLPLTTCNYYYYKKKNGKKRIDGKLTGELRNEIKVNNKTLAPVNEYIIKKKTIDGVELKIGILGIGSVSRTHWKEPSGDYGNLDLYDWEKTTPGMNDSLIKHYLFTPIKEKYYTSLNWKVIENTTYKNKNVVIMKKDI